MDIIEDAIDAQYLITSYTENEICINHEPYKSSFILSTKLFTQDWPVNQASELNEQTLSAIDDHDADIVIVGCQLIDTRVRKQLQHFFSHRQLGFELMTPAAACRTFRIIAAENRPVAVAIII